MSLDGTLNRVEHMDEGHISCRESAVTCSNVPVGTSSVGKRWWTILVISSCSPSISVVLAAVVQWMYVPWSRLITVGMAGEVEASAAKSTVDYLSDGELRLVLNETDSMKLNATPPESNQILL